MTVRTSDLRELVEKLVGQRSTIESEIPSTACAVLDDGGSGLGYSQLNELLLVLGFDRVTYAFFQYLVDGTTVYKPTSAIKSLDELASAVNTFRRLGLLLYGNVKYAFKVLSTNSDLLGTWLAAMSPVDESQFTSRHDPIRPIEAIPPGRTYYLGYMIERELGARLARNPDDPDAQAMDRERLATIEIGKGNQNAYLASDHLDVYIATSMRQRHEYLAVNRLANEIFNHQKVSRLKLRWFDPTQAYCHDRIDKGHSEALMLKRAKCPIYLAQEIDTLGKDSELASTLAQGKPVIAFVPEVGKNFASDVLRDLEIAYPSKRVEELLLEQLQIFEPTAPWTDSVIRHWLDDPGSVDVDAGMRRLQRSIETHYDKRAETLKETHPLGVQVNLATGVANGVLVVRTVEDCAQLVCSIVTRNLQFSLEITKKGASVLRETISGCVFRVATGDAMLTNAFWNFYLDPSE
jgi:hypothetical protein